MYRINNQTMRENNIQIILNTIRKEGSISRSDLAARLGLTSPAVTNIVSALIKEGLLVETGRQDSALGRKPILLSINAQKSYLVSLMFTTECVRAMLCDFAVRPLHTEEHILNPDASREEIVERLVGCVSDCIENSGVDRSKIMAIGIAAPGPLDVQEGQILCPPNFPELRNVPICEIMSRAFGIPAALDKETNAAALAEYVFGDIGEDQTAFAMLLMCNSIGGSVVHGGKVMHGFADGAGDIGHSLVDINGPRCSCGQYGCLERVACGDALVSRASSKIKAMNNVRITVPYDADALTLEDIFRYSDANVSLFKETVDYAARMIATAIGNVVSIVSPGVVMIGGAMVDMDRNLLPKIREYVHSRSYPDCVKNIRIEKSRLGADACLQGAAILAINRYQRNLFPERLL